MVNLWTLSLFLSSTLAATPDQWRTRSIYQIMTDRFALEDGSTSRACDVTDRQRCGGTWKGLQNKLDYIQDLGFDAVWISPISKNIEDDTPYGQAYHGYWTQDLYQLNNHMGSEADLNDLVTEMHNRDMYLMVDGVPNHFAHGTVPSDPVLSGPNRNIDLTGYVPFDSPEDYHDWCWVDYANDTSVTQCWMGDRRVPLMDLNTESPSVNATLVNYIQNTTALYGIDGLRVDAVKSIRKDFWRPWNDAAGVYSMGEVYTGDPGVMCEYQHDALDALLNFPVWEAIVGGYNDSTRSLANIPATVESVARLCTDPTLLGSFIENQDLPRFKAYTTDDVLSHNAITYVMTADGIPVLYYGYEAGFSGWNDPQNREALWTGEYSTDTMQYGWVKKLNSFRKAMIYSNGTYQPTQMTFLANDIPTHVISFLKGDSIVVTNNYGDGSASQTVNVQTPWAGQSVLEMWSNTSMTIPDSGTLRLTIENGAPMVFYPAALSSCVSGSSMDACQTGSTNRTAAPRPSVAFPSSSSSTATAGSTTTPSTTGSGDTATTSSEPNTSAEASTSGAESLLETFPATFSLVALALFAVMA